MNSKIFLCHYVLILCFRKHKKIHFYFLLLFNNESLLWRHNGHDGVSNHQPHDCLNNRVFRRRSKVTSKFRVTGLCEGNSPVPGEFPAQKASNAQTVSTWWRHQGNSYRSSCKRWWPLFILHRWYPDCWWHMELGPHLPGSSPCSPRIFRQQAPEGLWYISFSYIYIYMYMETLPNLQFSFAI